MAEYRIRNTGEVLTEQQYLLKLSGGFTEIVDVVFEGPQPSLTPPYQFSFRDGVQQIDGKWYTKYSIGPVFKDIVESDGTTNTAAQQEANYKAIKDSHAATQARSRRDLLLKESDFSQMRDVNLANNAEWVTYRQALRDVPVQNGFPWDVQWPEKP